jgi:hypothetical protein
MLRSTEHLISIGHMPLATPLSPQWIF